MMCAPSGSSRRWTRRWPGCTLPTDPGRLLRMKAKSFLAMAMLGLLAGGCASPNVNPANARPHTGYVDFYAVDADNL